MIVIIKLELFKEIIDCVEEERASKSDGPPEFTSKRTDINLRDYSNSSGLFEIGCRVAVSALYDIIKNLSKTEEFKLEIRLFVPFKEGFIMAGSVRWNSSTHSIQRDIKILANVTVVGDTDLVKEVKFHFSHLSLLQSGNFVCSRHFKRTHSAERNSSLYINLTGLFSW